MARSDDHESLQQARKAERAAIAAERAQLTFVMGDPRGRAFIERLLFATGCERATVFNPNAMVLAHDVGVKSLGHQLLEDIREACPELETIMRREAAVRVQRTQIQEDADVHEPRD